jgi:hypothetical protein
VTDFSEFRANLEADAPPANDALEAEWEALVRKLSGETMR